MPEAGQIMVEHLPDVVVVSLRGDHDVSTVPVLRAELDPVLAARQNVVVDLSEATFLDSTIIGVLFHAAATEGGILAIAVKPKTMLRGLIHTVGLAGTVPTFESRNAAVAYATTGSLSGYTPGGPVPEAGASLRAEAAGLMLGPRIARVEDIKTVETDLVEAQWKPVRNHFGITGFGTNAYVAQAPGELLIEDHSELRTGFEELYVVLRGRVEFKLEVEPGRDEQVSLGAGTLVFVPPERGRAARAETADAIVLAVGGVPLNAFSISEWETGRLQDAAKHRE